MNEIFLQNVDSKGVSPQTFLFFDRPEYEKFHLENRDLLNSTQGQNQDFKVGGGYTLKKNRAERREARKFWGYFL